AMIGSGGGVVGGASPLVSPRWLFIHADHLGSSRVITNSAGDLLTDPQGNPIIHHYMPFGDEKPIRVRVSSNNDTFTGHERDIESASTDNPDGLDYMLARYCSSSLDRFMTVDPSRESVVLSDPQSWNRYSYVGNNPIKFIDPD